MCVCCHSCHGLTKMNGKNGIRKCTWWLWDGEFDWLGDLVMAGSRGVSSRGVWGGRGSLIACV